MSFNSKKFVDYILEQVAKIEPNNPNVGFYRNKFKTMSSSEIEQLAIAIRNSQFNLPYLRENLNDEPINIEKWIDLAESLGAEVFSHLWETDPATGEEYLTPHKYMVPILPTRRQSQNLDTKDSIPVDNNTRDLLTGQVTGASKGSALSKPQLDSLLERGLSNTAMEATKARGGDVEASRVYNRRIIETGGANLEELMALGTEATVQTTLRNYFSGMMLAIDL